jgi:hypothetical protein
MGIGCHLRYKILKSRDLRTDWNVCAGICLGVGIILFMLSIITTMCAYSCQINDFENLKKLDKYKQIYLFKSEILTKKFENYLLKVYPQHEKDIFNKVKPQDIDIYFVRYPELKASETIKLLVGEVRTLQNDYYAQSLLEADIVRRITYRSKSPWLYYFLIPKYNK